MDDLNSIDLDEPGFIDLLSKLVGESEWLQNSPPQGLIPQEDKASNHVMELLEPYTIQNGGLLEMEVSKSM